MEVVLLWLDDLDDLVFTAALAWERLRQEILQIGLIAALALVCCEFSVVVEEWAIVFSTVAATSVIAWSLGLALRSLYRRERRVFSVNA